MLRRGVFYSHRDLDLVLDSYEENGRARRELIKGSVKKMLE